MIARARVLATERKMPEAIQLAAQAVQRDPASLPARDVLGSILIQANRLEDAKKVLAEVLRAAPRDVDAHRGMAVAYYLQNQHAKAIDEQKLALEAAPDQKDIRKDLTTLLVKEKRVPEAIALWEEASRRHADDADAHDELGLTLATNRDYAAAAKSFMASLALKPGDNTVRAHLARAHLERGKFESAATEARLALEADPKRTDARFILGQALARQGKPAEAAAEFERVLESASPGVRPDARCELGMALVQTGEDRKAAAVFTEAVRDKPDHPGARLQLGIVLHRTGSLAPALSQFAVALRLRPDDPAVHHRMGLCLRDAGRFEDAIEHLEEAVRLRPDLADAMIDLAALLVTVDDASLRNPARAATLARRAQALHGSRSAELLAAQAAVEAEAGHFPEAAKLQQRALDAAREIGDGGLTAQMQARLDTYAASRPYRLAATQPAGNGGAKQ